MYDGINKDSITKSYPFLPYDNPFDVDKYLIKIGCKGKEFANNQTEENFEVILNDIIQRKAWEEILLFGIYAYGYLLRAFLKCKELMPEKQRWHILLLVYKLEGFDFPKEVILEALQYRPADYLSKLPNKYNELEEITIYRCSKTAPNNIDILRDELSWTVSPSVAKHFYELRQARNEERYLYCGTINRDDIIAVIGFADDGTKGNREILQYRSVENIGVISIEKIVVKCVMEELDRRKNVDVNISK